MVRTAGDEPGSASKPSTGVSSGLPGIIPPSQGAANPLDVLKGVVDPRDAAAAARNAAANTQVNTSTPVNHSGKPRSQNDRLHLQAQPLNLHGGGLFRPGYMRRVPDGSESYDYRFYFLYNPYQIRTSTSINPERTAPPPGGDLGVNMSSGTQTLEFSVLLNRQMEQKDGHPAFRIEGTLHDTEALYKVLNGDPRDLYSQSAGTGNLTIADTTADFGFITMNPTELIFGPKMRYVGFVTSVTVEHKMFNSLMTPIYSEIGISFNRMSDNAPSAS